MELEYNWRRKVFTVKLEAEADLSEIVEAVGIGNLVEKMDPSDIVDCFKVHELVAHMNYGDVLDFIGKEEALSHFDIKEADETQET